MLHKVQNFPVYLPNPDGLYIFSVIPKFKNAHFKHQILKCVYGAKKVRS